MFYDCYLFQVDLVGQSIYEFVHPCDHEDITDIFHSNGRDKKKKSEEFHHTFFVRMKCTLTNKGKNVNLKSATYKVINLQTHSNSATYKFNIPQTSSQQHIEVIYLKLHVSNT